MRFREPDAFAGTPHSSSLANSSRPSPKTAQAVLKAFNTWAFKREQPTEPDLMLSVIADAVEAKAPLRFVLYWGKGPRSRTGRPETACLDLLRDMVRRIEAVHAPGVILTLIATDTHARHNGHCQTAIRTYFAEVAGAAYARGFSFCFLSAVVDWADVDPDEADEPLAPELEVKLRVCAAKWYRGEGSVADGAEAYYKLNMIERKAVEIVFPGAIFLTHNSSEFRDLFPVGLPVFYMYSMRKGISVKPWFVADNDGGDASGAAPKFGTAS